MTAVKQLLTNAFAKVKALYRREPVRVVTWTVGALLAVGAYFDVTLDSANVNTVVQVVLAVVLGGEVARQKVTPEAKVEAKVEAAKRETKPKRR